MSKYGLKVFNGKNGVFSTLESFVFLNALIILKRNYNTGIKETDDPQWSFQDVHQYNRLFLPQFRSKKDGYWNICQQTVMFFECYLFVRLHIIIKSNLKKNGVFRYLIISCFVSGARPLRTQSITGFNGRPIGNELSVGIHCASLCRVVRYYHTQHLLINMPLSKGS